MRGDHQQLGRSRDLLDVAEIAPQGRHQHRHHDQRLAGADGQGGATVLLAVDHPEDYDRWPDGVAPAAPDGDRRLTTAVALRLPGELRPMPQEIKKNLRAKRYARPE